MVSREQKRAALLHEKLQLLRSITNSRAESERSILADASKYIKELKDKVDKLNHEITSSNSSITTAATTTSCTQDSSLPEVTVEATEKGIMVNVYGDGNCPGLLVAVLEALEELNLNVIEARVSCTDSFRFEAVGAQAPKNEEAGETIVAQVVRQAILQAIANSMAEKGDQRS